MQTSYISLSFTTMTNSIKYTAKLSSALNHPLLECKEGKKISTNQKLPYFKRIYSETSMRFNLIYFRLVKILSNKLHYFSICYKLE